MRRSIVNSAVFVSVVALVAIAAVSVPVSRKMRQLRLNHALIEAAKGKDPTAVHALLASGADPNTRDTAPPPGFLEAIGELVGRIVHRQGHVTRPIGTPALVLYLSRHDEQGIVNIQGLSSWRDSLSSVIDDLIRHGCNVNAGAADGNTPLHVATQNRNSHICLDLLAHGANPNLWPSHSESPLISWSSSFIPGSIEAQTVELALIEHGARVNDYYAHTSALSYAVVFEQVTEVKALLAHGATLSGRENAEFTRPAAMASYPGFFKIHPASAQIWRLLVQHGVVPPVD